MGLYLTIEEYVASVAYIARTRFGEYVEPGDIDRWIPYLEDGLDPMYALIEEMGLDE